MTRMNRSHSQLLCRWSSRLALVLALSALATLGPLPCHAQLSSPVNFTGLVNVLRQNALGAVKGCNYQKYLSLADSLASAMRTFQSIDTPQPGKRWAVPFLDPLSMLFNAGSTMSARKTAMATHDGLALELEQVCNSVVQADQLSRQLQLMANGRLSVGVMLKWLLHDLRLGVAKIPGASQLHVQQNWTRFYTNAAPKTYSTSDTLWEAVDTALHATLTASGDMHHALDSLTARLDTTADQLTLYAERDSLDPTVWDCPPGYPDPNADSVQIVNGRRVCGPATPERSAQITAPILVLQTQIKAVNLAATARLLDVESVELMADNEQRRVRALMQNASALTF